MYIRSSLSWDRAEALCQDMNGHLAALTSTQELNFAQSLCASASIAGGCWVGGRGYNSTALGVGWKWSDEASHWNKSVFPGESLRVNCSTSTSCSRANINDSCTLVSNARVALVGERCNTSHGLICMKNQGTCDLPCHALPLDLVSFF